MSLKEQELVTNGQSVATNDVGTMSAFPEVRIGGLKVTKNLDSKWIESMKDTVKLRSDDIWIVTYPKCGTTWTQQVVRLIINGGKDNGLTLSEAVPWVECFANIPSIGKNYHIDIDKMASPRAFKSHFPYELMPCGLPSTTPGRYIYVVQNPRDVAVSFYHHERGFLIYPICEWDDFFERFLKGDVDFGDYFDHVLSWWIHKDDDNVLFLKYEDMKKNLPSTVATIAKFIGQDISKELIEEITERATFENMKKDSLANFDWMSKIRRPNESDFMRKGVVGDWKNYFTPEQIARLDAVYEKKLKHTGINLEFQ